jgi:hypothetical protein
VPTFDQLSAEQKAIIELVVKRGRSYDALADVLGMETSRVRELAQEALVELAPITSRQVDRERRGQIVDYVLGQQQSAERTATEAHLRRSEPARAWALSLLDSLDGMYAPGTEPRAPAVGAVEEAPRRRERERDRARPAVRERVREPRRRRVREAVRPEPLSPEAREAVRRRRLAAGGIGLILVAGITLGIVALSSGGGKKHRATVASAKILGEQLTPIGGTKGQGVAFLTQVGNSPPRLTVEAKLTPTKRGQAYEVWLYNSPTDAVSVGAQVTDQSGGFRGQGPLPSTVRGAIPGSLDRWRFIDVSLEAIPSPACQRNAACLRRTSGHSGSSVLRGAVANLRPLNLNALRGGAGAGGSAGGGAGGAGAPTGP